MTSGLLFTGILLLRNIIIQIKLIQNFYCFTVLLLLLLKRKYLYTA